MHFSPDQIIPLIIHYQYWIIFPLTIIEGPIITIIGWFLAVKDITNVFLLFLVALAGDIVWDLIHYGIGRWGQRAFSKKLVKIEGENPSKLQQMIEYLRINPGKTIVTGKWTHAMNSIILIGSGIAQVPMRIFLAYCTIGTTPKIIILIAVWYFFGAAYATIDTYISNISAILFVVIVALVIGFKYFKS